MPDKSNPDDKAGQQETATPPDLRDGETEKSNSDKCIPNYEQYIPHVVYGVRWLHAWSFRVRTWWSHDRILSALTFAIVCTTVTYTYYSGKQWHTMQQQLDLSQRPWVSIKAAMGGPLMFVGDPRGISNLNTTIRFEVENVGESVATSVTIIAEIIDEAGIQAADIANGQKRICESMRNERSSTNTIVLFKGDDPVPIDRWFSTNWETLSDFDPHKDPAAKVTPKSGVQLLLVGCVDYLFGFRGVDSMHHQTGFVFDLDYAQGHFADSKRAIPAALGSDPASDFTLYPWPYGGWYAD